jgi:serine phosphatase RsbU (regulator of sigma subunit)
VLGVLSKNLSGQSSRASRLSRGLATKRHHWRTIVRRATAAGPYVDEPWSRSVLSLVILAGILSVAATDKAAGPSVSVVSLYILPLALTALIYPLRVGVALSVLCLLLHHIVESFSNSGFLHLGRDLVTLAGYVFVVVVVNQLGRQRDRLAAVAQQQRDELASEIQLATEVQQSILPRTVPSIPGFEVAAKMYPAKMVAGDYYGFFELANGDIAFAVGDVSGKGVAAGLLMPSIEIALRLDLPRHPRSSELIQGFNDVVCQVTGGKRFISLFYGRLSPSWRQLEYTNAGHNPPLLLRAGCPPQQLCAGGAVLGVIPHAQYASERIELKKGDLLILYTDGLVEAESPEGESYSIQRLESTARAHLEDPVARIAEAIYASVIEFRRNNALEDDATLLLLKAV